MARRAAEKGAGVPCEVFASGEKVIAAKPRGPIHARPIAAVFVGTPYSLLAVEG